MNKNVEKFNKSSNKLKQKTIKAMNGEKLLETYNYYRDNFNPCDDEYCETYKMIEEEVLSRLW